MQIAYIQSSFTVKIATNTSLHLVNLTSNGQGEHYLSANDNTHYVAIDSSNSIQALTKCEIADVS